MTPELAVCQERAREPELVFHPRTAQNDFRKKIQKTPAHFGKRRQPYEHESYRLMLKEDSRCKLTRRQTVTCKEPMLPSVLSSCTSSVASTTVQIQLPRYRESVILETFCEEPLEPRHDKRIEWNEGSPRDHTVFHPVMNSNQLGAVTMDKNGRTTPQTLHISGSARAQRRSA